mgnify:CR=1 FL=1
MWEAVGNILTSSNALLVLITLVILVLVISILAKLGIFSLNIKGVNIGGDEDERAIIRQQTEWSQLFILGLQKHPIFKGYDTYHTLWVLEKMFDEVLNWIVFNHISDSENYISIKQEKIWNLIQTLVTEDKFTSQEFQGIVYENTEKLVKRLVYIRKNYRK